MFKLVTIFVTLACIGVNANQQNFYNPDPRMNMIQDTGMTKDVFMRNVNELMNELAQLATGLIQTAKYGDGDYNNVILRSLPGILDKGARMIDTGNRDVDDFLDELVEMGHEFIQTAINDEDDYKEDFMRSLPDILGQGTRTAIGYLHLQDNNVKNQLYNVGTKVGHGLITTAMNGEYRYKDVLVASLGDIIALVTAASASQTSSGNDDLFNDF